MRAIENPTSTGPTLKSVQLVVLNLGAGNLNDGFPYVTAQLWAVSSSLPEKFSGSLPSAQHLDDICEQWRLIYRGLCNRLKLQNRQEESDDELEIVEGSITHISEVSFTELCQQLETSLNQWLKSPKFINIELKLRSRLNPEEEIRLIIETNDEKLRRLPWQRWEFFKDYPLSEMALSRLEYKCHSLSSPTVSRKQVRILAILANSQGIDSEQERKFLQNLPEAETQFLVGPDRAQLDAELWHYEGWDIFFFAGHSGSEGARGRIYLNENQCHNSLTIEQLEEALSSAIEKGLKLAIFNSCEGLGLATSLGTLNIPQVIVMREPVPNRVAEAFFQYFLEAFAIEKQSLYLAVRQARSKLQGLEDDCPGASWLPVICQNPSVDVPTWDDLVGLGERKQHRGDTSAPATSEKTPPYPSGSVPLDSPFYLERSSLEEQVEQEIRKPGALIRIKAPREMGKTSLLLRILDYAKCLGYCTVSLNLEQVNQAILSDVDKFLRWLCTSITHQLQLQPKLDDYWDEDLGSKISSTLYLQGYLLKEIDTPFVLALDEVNQIFEHPQVARDFFPLLRSWYEEAKRLPLWQKLRLIVVHSTEIYVPLQLNQSPFNVGLPIQLTYFSLDEVQQLAQCYGLEWSDGSEARQLIEMVGGHPALVQIALYHLSRGEVTLVQLLEAAPTATGIYSHHLQRHRIILEEEPELAIALQAVMSTTEPVELEPIAAYKLSSMGLIKQSGNKALAGCELYRLRFRTAYRRIKNEDKITATDLNQEIFGGGRKKVLGVRF